MEMTETEVVKKYLEAKYKTKRVKELAELNACSTATIEGILKKHGVTYPPKPGPVKKEEQEVIDKALEENTEKIDIPPAVRDLVVNKIFSLVEEVNKFDEQIADINAKREACVKEKTELEDFLNVNFYQEEENDTTSNIQ